ncbi:MAG: carboxypeptidase regulatory-like domain-containing protein [Acidobacteriia bacterium]|nr:carboxypeptidase regulatory-like domain-containing protein [Terriglobia bacterium]
MIAGAEITITQVNSGSVRTLATNTDGVYYVPDIPPGRYEMKVAAPGYVTQLWTSISVAAGVPRIFNPVLQAGDPQQTVRVVAPPALVTETCTSACGNVSSSTVSNTPINGRDWAQLATLQAGVTGVQANGGNSDRGFGAPISISGSRPDQNSFRLDAVSINDYTNGAPGSVLGDNLGIDAVDQVSVLGSNYPAEYGRTSGGLINAVTKSGTNSLHGTLYEFLRNSALDARNFFDGPTIPSFRRNQFGASAGAPIRKGRTFVFGDYEGLRQSLGVTSVDKVPSVAARAGNLSTGPVTVDPAVARFIAAFYPLPNGPLLGAGDTGIYTFAAQQITTENYFTVRLDHKFSEADSVSATYMRDNSKTNSPDSYGELFSDVVIARQIVAIHETHVFSPTLLNAFTFGFSRDVATIGKVTVVNNPLMNDHSYAFQPGGFAGRIQNVPGITNFNGAPLPNGFVSSSRSIAWNSFQAGDDVFLTRGIHTLKFGGNVERMQDNQLSNGDINGSFTFSTLQNFLTNIPQAYSGTVGLSQPVFGMRQTLFGAYIQDDMRLQKNLTFNAGLRYEMVTVPREAHNMIANLRNLGDAQPALGSRFFQNPTLRNFEPRLGFAWNPQGGKTLIRGGFGVFDVLPLPYEFTISIQSVLPFVHQIYQNVLPPDSFPTGAFEEFSNITTSSRAFYAQFNPKRNYVMQWNLSAAQELSSTLAVTLGYVGSRGVHQPYRVDNIDMVLPAQLTSAGYLWPCGPNGLGNQCASGFLPSGTQANPVPSPTVNPNYGRISAALWQANSSYDALQANVTKRMSHGFTFTGAYTWGKSIDTLSSTEANDAFPNGLFNQLYFDQSTTRGLSDFNVAQTFVFNLTWEIPTPAIDAALAKTALGGWQIGALYKVSTGQPFTLIMGGDPVGMHLEETGLRPSRSNGSGCQSSVNPGNPNNYVKVQCLTLPYAPSSFASQCAAFPGAVAPPPSGSVYCANLFGNLGRNTLIGPGLAKLDVSIFKNNYIKRISESFNVQFRAEFFNVLNRANFASPTDNLEAFDQSGRPISSAGLIDSTQTTSRQIQFALKMIW